MEVGRCPGCIQIHCHPDQDEVVTGERVNCGTGLVQIGVLVAHTGGRSWCTFVGMSNGTHWW